MSALDALLDVRLAESFTGAQSFNASQHPRGSGGLFIQSGSSGDGVSRVQGAVGAKQDGQFGAETKKKIMAYQRKHGLVVDGVVGRQTAASLLGDHNASSKATGALSRKQARDLGMKVPAKRSRRKHH